MSIVSSPQDFDPRILVSEPLMFLNWYNNPDVTIYREPRKAIPLSSKVRRSHHRVQRPLTNEQILSIKTHYYLEWQLLAITTIALVLGFFLFNPLLLFYVRFEIDRSLSASYSCLLFIVYYGAAIVSIVFWMIISRLSIWHNNFNTAKYFIEESKRAQSTTNKHSNRSKYSSDTERTEARKRRRKRRKNRQTEKGLGVTVEDESDGDDGDDGNASDDDIEKQKYGGSGLAGTQEETKEAEFINTQTQKLKRETGMGRQNNHGLTVATTRVTGFILAIRWSLFGYGLSLGIFSACETYNQLIMASALAGAFFPALLVSSSNIIVYAMKRLPSVQFDLKLINYIIMFGWIFLPLITCIIGEFAAYRWPFVFGAVVLLSFVGVSMFCHPGKPTIAMIAEREPQSEHLGHDDTTESTALNESVTGHSAAMPYDDTTPLRIGGATDTYDDQSDDTSSVTSDASSIFRMHGDHDVVPQDVDGTEEKDGRPIRGGNAAAKHKIRYENELRRAGLDPDAVSEQGDRPRCDCIHNPIVKNSCEFNHRLLSSSMGVFQIATFLLLIQSFAVDLCVGCYLTWYPMVMYDAFNQRYFVSGIQMMVTGIVVIFSTTWVAKRNTTQFFLYGVNAFASFFTILLCICMIRFASKIFYWFVFPLIMSAIVVIGMISRMMLSRITPHGCLSFINGSSQIFRLAAFGIGPLILGIIDAFGDEESDTYFFSLFYCLMVVHVCSSVGLYLVQLAFTAIKIWGFGTYQNRP